VHVITDNLPTFMTGFRTTVQLTAVSGAVALTWGLVLATLRVAPLRSLRAFATTFVELLRNTPLTLVFFFMVLIAPQFGVIAPLGFWTACICLSAYTSAFVCEAVRSGINSVGVGQAEAARAVGLTFGQTLSHVVLPQAVRSVIPPLINVFVALANPEHSVWVLVGVAAFYLLITIPSGILAGAVERTVAFAR